MHALAFLTHADQAGVVAQFFGCLAVMPLAEAAFPVDFRADVVHVGRQLAHERANQCTMPLLVIVEGFFQLCDNCVQIIACDAPIGRPG